MIRLYYEAATGKPLYTTPCEGTAISGGVFLLMEEVPASLLGYQVIEGALVLVDLEPRKASLQAILLAKVRVMRQPLVTELPGQEMVYLRKEQEALAFLADPDPVITEYPLLKAEIGITAPTAYQLAQIWINMSSLWRTAAAQLEAYRLGIAAQIDAATTMAQLDLIEASFNPAEAVVVPEAPIPETPVEVEQDVLRETRWQAHHMVYTAMTNARNHYLHAMGDTMPTEEEHAAALLVDDLAVISAWEINQLTLNEIHGLHMDAAIAIENATEAVEIEEAVSTFRQEVSALL